MISRLTVASTVVLAIALIAASDTVLAQGRGGGRRGGNAGPPVAIPADARAGLQPLPEAVLAPSDNPTTPEKIALGRLLFWDPVLSGHHDVACATCHHPAFGYADRRALPIGVHGVGLSAARRPADGRPESLVQRNSPTVVNAAFNGIDASGAYDPAAAPMFWDIRVRSLEAQALEPIKNHEEMRGDAYAEADALDAVVARLAAIPEYRQLFETAFGAGQAVTPENLGKAIAAFERSLVAADSPFDRYMRGDTTAMSAAQIRGMARFEQVGCINCHSGPMFSDFQVHVLSAPENRQLPAPDTGTAGTFAFRTASLRNVGLTAPYMHSGVFATLGDVIGFYRDVRRRSENPNVGRGDMDPLLRRLSNVNRGERDLVAFLNALTDDSFDRTVPERVPSGLSPGGAIE